MDIGHNWVGSASRITKETQHAACLWPSSRYIHSGMPRLRLELHQTLRTNAAKPPSTARSAMRAVAAFPRAQPKKEDAKISAEINHRSCCGLFRNFQAEGSLILKSRKRPQQLSPPSPSSRSRVLCKRCASPSRADAVASPHRSVQRAARSRQGSGRGSARGCEGRKLAGRWEGGVAEEEVGFCQAFLVM
jgi:hypothetical protein